MTFLDQETPNTRPSEEDVGSPGPAVIDTSTIETNATTANTNDTTATAVAETTNQTEDSTAAASKTTNAGRKKV